MTSIEPFVIPNGVDANTGEYLLPPMPVAEVARAASAAPPDPTVEAALRARHRRATEAAFAPKHGVDPGDLGQTGWGVVFAADGDPAIRAALAPLLDHRRTQAGAAVEWRYREFSGADGYRNGESKQEFLSRHGSGPGPVDPDVMPYYLLIVGDPGDIPFDVQYQLDVQHAVGRIDFDDLDGYARYAENVVAAETKPAGEDPVKLTFFAAENDGDHATALSVEHLVGPLASSLGTENSRWQVRSMVGSDATKESLQTMLASSAPDLLFTATHGLGVPAGSADQRTVQGGLVCQDWPGPGRGRIGREHWFDARDLPAGDLTGMIAVIFACFGAGTPRHDDFDFRTNPPRVLAPAPFVAALPKAMLGREGGALAVVGHVDRAWEYSFRWPGAGRQTEVYRSTLAELGAGQPVGSALEYVGDRYAELATDLRLALEEIRLGRRADDTMLAGLWTACMDARGFALLGDPAVRLTPALAGPSSTATRTLVRATHAAVGRPAESESSERDVLAPSRQNPVEVATYVTDDPEGVEYDPVTGCIRGARLHLFSSVDLDGAAAHVVSTHGPGEDAERDLTDLHTRMVEVSIAARRAQLAEGGTR